MSEEREFPVSDPRISVTSVEPTADRAAVTPYRESPLVELWEGVLGCEYCGYNRFRRSRVRFSDLTEILRLRFPMRCMRCSQRQYADMTLAFLSYPPKVRGQRVSEGVDTWQDWTRSSPEIPLSTRPMTTAMGTSARRLTKQEAPVAPVPAAQTTARKNGDNEIW